MERTWTKIGEQEIGKPLDDEHDSHVSLTRELVARAIGSMEWKEVPCTTAAMPGLAIKALVKELRLPKVSHVAVSNELAPNGLIGVRAHYKNGSAEVYALDTGTAVTPLLSDFHQS